MNTDVLIIGAGPAGAAAGAILAQKGRSVTTLESLTFPRFQIGESLLPRCNDLLQQAGLFDAVVARRYIPKPGALFLRGDQTERFCFAEMFPGQQSQTYQVPRSDFDQTLATRSRELGNDIRFNTRVDSIEFASEGGTVMATDLESNERLDFHAKWVIDCSGYGRVLPKMLGVHKASHLKGRIAMFTMVEGDVRPTGDREGDIWIVIHPRCTGGRGAWAWIIPFSNGRTSVGLVADKEVFDAVPGCDRDRLMALLREDPNAGKRLAKAVPVMKVGKLQDWSAAVSRMHGPRWVLTGNAGEFLDPVFSSGVTLALESACLAARLVDDELAGRKPDWDVDYDQPIKTATGVFKAFVDSWYDDRLPGLLLAKTKTDLIKRAITAVLGGYVLDEKNPFVRDPLGTLNALFKMA